MVRVLTPVAVSSVTRVPSAIPQPGAGRKPTRRSYDSRFGRPLALPSSSAALLEIDQRGSGVYASSRRGPLRPVNSAAVPTAGKSGLTTRELRDVVSVGDAATGPVRHAGPAAIPAT